MYLTSTVVGLQLHIYGYSLVTDCQMTLIYIKYTLASVDLTWNETVVIFNMYSHRRQVFYSLKALIKMTKYLTKNKEMAFKLQ